MDMRQFIQRDIANSKGSSASSLQKKRECLNVIDAYIGESTPIDCLQVISTGWLDGFENYMLTAKEGKIGIKSLSPSTAAFRKKTLVAYCREAMKQNLCPNIKIIPEHGAVYGKEIERLPVPDRRKDMERLLSMFYLGVERINADDISGDALITLKRQTGGIGYAILSVLLCGIGFAGLSKLLKEYSSAESVYLPHLDVDIELPDHIFAILDWLRLNGSPNNAAAIEHEALAAIGNTSILFKDGFKEPFTQWIEMAISVGLSYNDARRIIDRLYVKDKDDSIQRLVKDTFHTVVSKLMNFSYAWYCIKSTVPSGDTDTSGGARLLQVIIDEAAIHPIDSFCPQLKVVTDRDGRKEIRKDRLWDSLLLVKVNQLQIDAINRFLMSRRCGFIYGILDNDGMKYSKIRDGEIAVIRDFFEDKDKRRINGNVDLTGRKVQVQTGLYEGYDGTIIRVIFDKDHNIHRLILKLQGTSANVTYKVDSEYIQLAE